MPEITVTETQRERLADMREELEAAYIDTYGHIRTTDVVQYLLDTYTPPEQRGDVAHERIATAEFQDLQAVATDVEGVPGSGIDAETMRGELLSTLGVAEFAARLAAVEDGEPASSDTGGAERSDSGADDAESSGADSEPDDAAADSEEPPADDADTASDGASDDGGSGPTPNTDGPGSILSAANQLLTDHDDKWREGGGDEPYEVDLPDGTTETVRTKDDVRGLLFKHY
ncbi:hypothetical protein [Haloarcula sediminis]|uniref:hypothetical protein n=1 Tax=Haloarcula sediminis TaxID=3111777 RepID=UPI002D79AAD4|nr:hypothetical protein [Haloarcula sp. CK38]